MSADTKGDQNSGAGTSGNQARAPESLAKYVSERMDAAIALTPPASTTGIGIAVSGGGDSTALLVLLSRWCRAAGTVLRAASVDHGLRPEARREIEDVRSLAESLGHEHSTLRWQSGSAKGNLQDSARRARYRLLQSWAADSGVHSVALGHTEDDQAETFLLRLARGSGVDGLACMSEASWRRGIWWLRPLLGIRRRELREFLASEGISWAEDPSNENRSFDRIKVRHALQILEPAGLSVPRLAATAYRMRIAKEALQAAAKQFAREACRVNGIGDLVFSAGIWNVEEETRCRILAQSAMFLAGHHYRPRFRSLRRILEEVAAGGRATISGCLLEQSDDGGVLVGREPAFCQGTVDPGAVWDGRWRIERVDGEAFGNVAMLGETGLVRCPRWKDAGFRKSSVIASPAIWDQGELVAAPMAGFSNGWRATLLAGKDEFLASLEGH